jgi:L-aspartate oxidase
VAGLMLGLKLAKFDDVVIIAKGALQHSNSWHAQGGIASVLDATDSFTDHINDTHRAGAGLCHQDIVELVVTSGPSMIQELVNLGVPFSQDAGGLRLHKEGGHSHRRVIHAADMTGQAVMETLIQRTKEHPRITVLEHTMAVDLLTTDRYAPDFSQNKCLGAYVFDKVHEKIYKILSANTYIATGGHGKIYQFTTNPDAATGDGVAIAWRGGCRIANLEFMQFHPTCLYHPSAKNFLITEALRGEGAILRDHQGRDFMAHYHPLGSLAPRDIVARAIDLEMKKTGVRHVFLDITHKSQEFLKSHFPNVFETCFKLGIDISKTQIPVVPAAHYSCGGIVVDRWGRTGVVGLYALGEAACTGLHGANRLASNSLLEALVFAHQIALDVGSKPQTQQPTVAVPDWNSGSSIADDEKVVLAHTWDEIRNLMWQYVGIVRSDRRLKRAFSRINAIIEELDRYYWDTRVTAELLEVRNLALVAMLTIRCAMARKESRGIHFNIDFPEPDSQFGKRDTLLR